MKIFTEKAYAKVNFNLRVLPNRADGYHNIESIFQKMICRLNHIPRPPSKIVS